MKRTLQLAGALGLLAWTALGAWAWWDVRGQVQVTFQEEGYEGGAADASQLALLGDRLDSMSRDLDALVRAHDENLGLLAGTLEQRDVSAANEQARTVERLTMLETTLTAALGVRETAPLATPLSADHEPAAQSAEAGVASAPERAQEQSKETPHRKSFLAFHLPSRDFQFEGLQTFEVLEDLSRVGFDAKSTLHDFSGVSNRVRGYFRIDLAHAGKGVEGRVELASSSLDSGLEGRDEAMLEHLDEQEFKAIVFEPTGFEVDAVDSKEMRLSGDMTGRMTIRGVTKDVHLRVEARVDESRRLVVEGEMPLLLSDYAIPVPNKLGVISVDDEVRVWIRLRTRARAEGTRQ